jgi:transcriptional regulator with XRE-family HTH domain
MRRHPSVTFSAWLKARREAAGLSQEELAKKAGTTQRMVSRIESGEADPRLSDFLALVRSVGGTVSDALGLEEGGQDAMTAELLSEWLSMPVAARRSLLEFIRHMRGGGRDGRG